MEVPPNHPVVMNDHNLVLKQPAGDDWGSHILRQPPYGLGIGMIVTLSLSIYIYAHIYIYIDIYYISILCIYMVPPPKKTTFLRSQRFWDKLPCSV